MTGAADGHATAVAAKEAIVRLGGGFMRSREAKEFGDRVGLGGWRPYFRGRCGVLGEVDADVVAATAAFFPPSVVRDAWDGGREAVSAEDAVRSYAEACRGWGRRKLAGFDQAARLAELLTRVVDSAGVIAAPLFAGWRAVPLPDDPAAGTAQLAQVLREHRGGMHAVAVVANGLTPLQAILTSRPDDAAFFGWPQPYPEYESEVRQRRSDAERLTDELVASAYSVLTEAEAAEFVELLDEACQVAFPPQ